MKVPTKLLVLPVVLACFSGCVTTSVRELRDNDLLISTGPICPPSAADVDLKQVARISEIPIYSTEKRVDRPFHLIEAIGLAFQNSPVVRVQAGTSVAASDVTFFDIQAREAKIIEELAAFDTTFESSLGNNRFKNPPDSFFGPGLVEPSERDELFLNFGWSKRLVWGGTTSVSFNPTPNYLFIPDQPLGSFNPRHVAEWEFSVVQPLLRGAGRTFNLAPLEISQLSANQSAWDFKDEVMTSVRDIVAAYWDLYAAGAALDAIELLIPLVEEIVRIQREAHKAEWVTITEVAKAEAQMYEFRRERETRRSDVLAAELRLRDLIGLPPEDGTKLIPITKPLEQQIAFSPQAVMLDALDNQPDLVRRRIDIQVRSLEKEVALNGQKLQLDAIAVSRRNGVGESVDDAMRQTLTAEFYDWELGLKLTVPLGRRQAAAQVRASEQLLAKEKLLFDQQIFTTQHDLQDNLRSIEFAYRQYSETMQQLAAADRWVEGAKLRYQNPGIGDDISNVLVTNLNEYLNSLRFRTSAAIDKADLIARYNSEMLRLEDTKGTILEFFGIAFNADPCRQSANFPRPTFSQLWPADDALNSDPRPVRLLQPTYN